MNHWEVGDIGYIIENNMVASKVIIQKVEYSFLLIRFADRDAAIRLKPSRIYRTAEEAKKSIIQHEENQRNQWWLH